MGERKRAIRFVDGGKLFPIRNNQNAQALVELALILPLLLVLIVGAIEYGRLFYTKIIITNAAREGVYYMTTHSTGPSSCLSTCVTGTFTAAYDEALSSGIILNPDDVTIAIRTDPEPDTDLFIGKVSVHTEVDNLLILGFVLGDVFHVTGSTENFPLTSSVEMMIQ